ncbi:MAG: hypothetical protein U0939_11635 [Pirellulales bacterium]
MVDVAERMMLTGNAAAAWGARLAAVEYVPAFPITPQTEIIELLADWFTEGSLRGKFVTLDSEHSMLTAAGAAAVAGVRVFSATSSQGLVYALETLYTTSGWRVPMVMVNVSRGLSAPITLGPDHNDILAARDAGWIQLHAESCQEVLDFILLAYRIAEDPRVSAPAPVNLDGFQLSFTREAVELPTREQARRFLPRRASVHPTFSRSTPLAHGVAVLDGASYSYFRYQLHRALENAVEVFHDAAGEFAEACRRRYEATDDYRMEDAELALVMIGSSATLGKQAVDRWRDQGVRIGLVRPRLLRPLPVERLRRSLGATRAVAIVDQNLAPGAGGILRQELATALYDLPSRPALHSFVCGLGGKEMSDAEFDRMLAVLQQPQAQSPQLTSELLMTQAERAKVAKALAAAGKEQIDHASR